MKNNMIDAKRIRLGKKTYFDVTNNGSVVPSVDAYAFLINVNGTYVNPFNLAEEVPIFDRLPYSNTTLDGEDYGTKIELAQGDLKSGECYVLEKMDISEYYGKDEMSLGMLEDIIIASNKFFIDRIGLLEEKGGSPRRKHIARRKILDDKIKLKKFKDFIEECRKDEDYRLIK